jgi:Leucine-rich repeat (LRR) protein
MRKTFNLMAMAALLLTAACEDEKERVPALSANPTSLTFGREGGEATFNITSDSKWIINRTVSWYSIDQSSGELDATVTVNVSASAQPTERIDTLHLLSGITSATVVIKQLVEYEDITGFVTDENLKTALKTALDKNSNGKVSSAEANNVKTLDISGNQIASIDGLEYLPALEELDASNNALASIDLSKTPFLTKLDVSDNNLTAIDLAQVPDLTDLNLSNNTWQTNTIDITAGTNLTNLDLTGTGILYVNVWTGFDATALTYLPADLRFRGASAPAVTVVPGLLTFDQDDASGSLIFAVNSNIDWTITGAPAWINLSATSGHDNVSNLTATVTSTNDTYEERSATLTISGDGANNTFVIKQNGIPLPPLTLSTKRVENAATTGSQTVDILSNRTYSIFKTEETWFTIDKATGSGASTLNVNFQANPEKYTRLGCITVAELNGTDTTALKMILVRQNGTTVPQDDDDLFDYVPDVNFQAALLATSNLAKNGDGIITVATAKAYNHSTGLSMYNKSINSLVGIELFTSLERAYIGVSNDNAARNHIQVLDFSRNTALTHMDGGRIQELILVDVSSCPNLTNYTASYTKQGDLDFTANPKLTLLNCNGGSYLSGVTPDFGRVRNANITNCPDLTNLQLACNMLTELDLSNNTKLASTVYLRRNRLKTLDASALQSVATLNLKDNALESIILPVRTSTQDLTVNVDNTTDYGSDKMFNNVSVVDASKTFGIYQIDVSRNPNCTTIYLPISHDNPTVRVVSFVTTTNTTSVTTENVVTPTGINVILIDPAAGQ